MMASATWKIIRPHIPLIKFRKGGPLKEASAQGASHGTQAAAAAAQTVHATAATAVSTQKSAMAALLEDYQLPPRFNRLPISEDEIAYINRGGPE